jgi:hypothetical protein
LGRKREWGLGRKREWKWGLGRKRDLAFKFLVKILQSYINI